MRDAERRAEPSFAGLAGSAGRARGRRGEERLRGQPGREAEERGEGRAILEGRGVCLPPSLSFRRPGRPVEEGCGERLSEDARVGMSGVGMLRAVCAVDFRFPIFFFWLAYRRPLAFHFRSPLTRLLLPPPLGRSPERSFCRWRTGGARSVLGFTAPVSRDFWICKSRAPERGRASIG